MKTSFKKELLKAKQHSYAIPAFNWDNLDMLKGIIEAAEEMNSPVIVMITEGSAKTMGIDYATMMGVYARNHAKVPVILHWDHGFDKTLTKKAIDSGFDSVMLDASKEPFMDNVEDTQEIVRYAHDKGVEVESEIGHVGGKEDDRDSQGQGYTDPLEAKEFDWLTNIDALAIAVGTAHGLYKGKVELQFDLIKKIASEIETPLVLHGSSDVPLEQLQEAIKCGITKINIGTDLKVANSKAIRNWLNENPTGFDSRKFNQAGVEALKIVVKEKILTFGSDNKADI